MITEVLLFLLTFLLVFAISKDRKPSNMPPGPWEIPFIGNVMLQYSEQIKTYKKKYGNIFTTRFGNARTVLISDYDAGKEAFQFTDFADRPTFFAKFNVQKDEKGGVVSSNGTRWIHDRRFMLRNLRDLGMGKSYLEEAIHIEAQALVEEIKSLDGKPVRYPRSLKTAVLNVIWQMVASKRYDLKSTEVDQIFNIMEAVRNYSFMMFLEDFFPIMYFIPASIKNYFFGSGFVEKFSLELQNVIHKVVKEHEKNLDINDPHDFIDEFLIEMKKENKSETDFFNYKALDNMLGDMFGAGSETITTTLKWVIRYAVEFPETAKRCKDDIERAVPKGSVVSLQHRNELPYIEAFISETLRHSSMLFMGVLRMATKDTTLQGYFIPKGTGIAVDAYSVHHDPQFWENPNQFRPERFLDDQGKFQSKFGRSFAFGSGRRQCVGEALARMELYIFTSAIMQNFDIELPQGETLNSQIMERVLVRFPAEQELVYKFRK